MRRAHLCAAGIVSGPPLRDAVVTWIGDKRLTVIGIEAPSAYTQVRVPSWYAEIGVAGAAAPRAGLNRWNEKRYWRQRAGLNRWNEKRYWSKWSRT